MSIDKPILQYLLKKEDELNGDLKAIRRLIEIEINQRRQKVSKKQVIEIKKKILNYPSGHTYDIKKFREKIYAEYPNCTLFSINQKLKYLFQHLKSKKEIIREGDLITISRAAGK